MEECRRSWETREFFTLIWSAEPDEDQHIRRVRFTGDRGTCYAE